MPVIKQFETDSISALVAIMDCSSSRILSWRISNTLVIDFCSEALNEAIRKFVPPEIVNTDSRKMVTSTRLA
ncbi:transposase family protein [Pseudohalocynthiibacter aestuariivivens]|nr:transposase family protein [Pseudohalocynthiibacter aestuariivivens]QIE45555.1 transposase family protein [Pseudohalocynthiibacter aestuariivivens]